MAVVKACNNHVGGVARNALVVFGEDFAPCSNHQIGADFLGVVVDQLAAQATPILILVAVGEAVIVNGEVDFTSMNYSYQPFTGGTSPIYLNSGFNIFLGTKMKDLMEDYKIEMGVKLNTNLVNNEYRTVPVSDMV